MGDSNPPNSTHHVNNPPERLSISDSRKILKFKLSSSSFPKPEIGHVSRVITRDEDNNMMMKQTACNMSLQPVIGEKKSARITRSCVVADRDKFYRSLSRSEIEHDFMVMTGKKMLGKPKKRPRAIFPGQCLSEVHADKYEVKENGKR
ncbi:hypothetical protein CTI12_AA130540 [Artemisia annua]|uniref:Uncharacterized protein n=1 Tax=Artemisia annua TaxID=35608 RepID=A0A2U1PL57_ARTAN|nr:hypothetical protein CTI12_AA130540 [Artemisia annua]